MTGAARIVPVMTILAMTGLSDATAGLSARTVGRTMLSGTRSAAPVGRTEKRRPSGRLRPARVCAGICVTTALRRAGVLACGQTRKSRQLACVPRGGAPVVRAELGHWALPRVSNAASLLAQRFNASRIGSIHRSWVRS